MPYNNINKIPILSFFTGGGFMDMGFEKAGFEIIFSNEIDKDFAQFYREGMSSWSNESKEITVIDDIENIHSGLIKPYLKEGFGIIGGPPCQDFSVQGSKAGFEGLMGTQTYHFYEKIMDLQPTFFLMENVPGLVLLNKTKSAFEKILELFRKNYLISLNKLNSLHFAVPQNRERLFIFGIKKELVEKKSIRTLNDSWFDWPKKEFPNAELIYNWKEPNNKIQEIKENNLAPPPIELCVENILINDEEKNKIPNANEYFKIKNIHKVKNIPEGDTYRPSFKRLHRKKYSPTACYGNNEVHLHPVYNRRISVREALRIQGIPDSYILESPGKLTKKFKMIGNGVPFPLGYKVADTIKQFLINQLNDNLYIDGHLVKEEEKSSNVKNPVKGY